MYSEAYQSRKRQLPAVWRRNPQRRSAAGSPRRAYLDLAAGGPREAGDGHEHGTGRVPACGQPGAGTPARGRAFALPVSTSFRFTLLIAAVVASSFFVYEGIYLATPRGPALISLLGKCRSQALAQHPRAAFALPTRCTRPRCVTREGNVPRRGGACSASACSSSWPRHLPGSALVVPAAEAPDRTDRGRRCRPGRRLEGVRQRAGTGPLVWLLQPLNARLSAFAFGRPGRRFVAVSGGAAVAAVRKPAAFDAVILHELAHIKNRDIDQTYLALAIWRAFVVAALLPLAVVLIVTRVLSEPQLLIWRMAVLALIVYSLRNAILRSREFDADARARQIDPRIALDTVLASLPARTGRRAWHLGWKHPSGRERAAALPDPAPLYRFGFWDGLAIGLVAALGASAAHEIVTLLSTTVGITGLSRRSSSRPSRDPRSRSPCGESSCWRRTPGG